MKASNSGSDMIAPPTVTSGTYTAASVSATSATTCPQSCAAMTPTNATIAVPTNACAMRATR
jgi:hypothetical protein